jgi:two-component system, NtrC family, sensor kinase
MHNNPSQPPHAANSHQAPCGVVLLNQQFELSYINQYAAAVFNIEPKQGLGQPLKALFPELNQQFLEQAAGNSQTVPIRQRCAIAESANGTPDYNLLLVEINNNSTENKYIGLVQANICNTTKPAPSNFKQALTLLAQELEKQLSEESTLISINRQLIQAEKMASIGQLAAGVAHEINNPLGFVFSNLKSLEEYIDSLFKIIDIAATAKDNHLLHNAMQEFEFDYIRSDLISLFEESKDGLQRVKKIITSLKDFSHIDEEKFAPADIHKGIETTLSVAQNEIKYKAEIIREFTDLPPVECIASQINQVIMNLAVNAAHAITSFGEIHIRTGLLNDMAWIEVEDNGSGISAQHIEHIFEPFFTTKPVGTGTGLGLSLSRTIIEKHHGRLEVDSNIGRGSRFRVWLPIKQTNS